MLRYINVCEIELALLMLRDDKSETLPVGLPTMWKLLYTDEMKHLTLPRAQIAPYEIGHKSFLYRISERVSILSTQNLV